MGLPGVGNLPDPWEPSSKHIGLTPSAASVSTSASTSKDSLSDPPSSEGRHEEKCLDEVQMCWAGEKDKKEKDSTLKSPRMPSERVARIMQSYGPSTWQMVQQCGWKGQELADGTRQDLFCEHLHAQGFLFVKDEYLYYIKVGAECDLPGLHSALQDVMKGIDIERQRVCVRTDAASRRRFKSERPRLVTHFKLLDFK